MKEIVVVSGKGGTGKTTVVASLIRIFGELVIADCDVDASNLHMIIPFSAEKSIPYSGSKVPVVNKDICTGCDECGRHCRFGAIKGGEVDLWSCDHCGLCMEVCPEEAIEMVPEKDGDIFVGNTPFGPMVYGELLPGAENSGKMVAEIRKIAREMAKEKNKNLILLDGPPGIGCPVISSITGTKGAVVVTEPTPSGVHDLERMLELLNHFRIKSILLINKWDLNKDITKKIVDSVEGNNVLHIAKIPFNEDVIKALKKGRDPVSSNIKGIKEVLEEVAGYMKSYFNI